MNLSLQNFSTLVSNSCAVAQSSCSSLVSFTAGSVTRAVFEANATVALWIQYLILQVLSVTRLSTSFGDDVDSWIEQFGMTRLGASAATTTETFISLSPDSSSAIVPVGAIVKSSDGSVLFSVVKDSSNANWSESSQGYVRQKGVASITCPIVCTVAGSVGNVMSGVLNILGTQISGIDTCTNISVISNGYDKESDASVKSRVNLWFSSLSSATLTSIEYAISSVSSSIVYQIVENRDVDNSYRSGFFYIAIDDGSGDISTDLLDRVKDSIENSRACGVEFSVIRASVVYVSVVVPVVVKEGVDVTPIEADIKNSISDYVNGLAVGALCSYTKISSVALESVEGDVTSMGVITVNQSSLDVGGSVGTVVRVGSIDVSVTYG